MITVNMHEAKTRLSKLVKAVEEENETVILQRNGRPVAEIHRCRSTEGERVSRLVPNPELQVTFAPGFDPAELATDADWPEDNW